MGKKQNNRRYRHSLWPAILALVLVMLVALCAIGWALLQSLEFKIELQGDETVTLEYGESYSESGAKVYFAGYELTDVPVEADGEVGDGLGEYTVTYQADFLGRMAQAQRIISVVDTQAPVITLTVDPDAYTEPGCEYIEEGYTALDNVDGDLTDKVERTEENGVVTYTVTDSSGNSTTVERTIVYEDKTPPELTLLGDEVIRITAGEKYKEPGYTATDNADGDITVNVTVTGEYDISMAGKYTIHYAVSDSSGNEASADRTLVVEEPEEEVVIDPNEKVIYLTFDDGPGERTLELLDILEKYDAKVTFFVVGTGHLEYLDEIAEAGHAIGLHANAHNYSYIYDNTDVFFKDLYKLQDKVFDRTGVTTWLHRFPGGSSNTVSKKYCVGIMSELTGMVEEAGFTYFDWDVDSNDAGGAKTAEEVYNNVVSGIGERNHVIVLQHDIKSFSVDAVEMILEWGTENGYVFRALDENSPTAHHHVNN